MQLTPDDIDIPLTEVGAVLTRQRITIENQQRDRATLVEVLCDWQRRFHAAHCETCWGEYRTREVEPCEDCWGTGYDWDENKSGGDYERKRIKELEGLVDALKATIADLQDALVATTCDCGEYKCDECRERRCEGEPEYVGVER